MLEDFWDPPSGIIQNISAGPRRAYWSLNPNDRPDYQELETIQPRKVERFPYAKRITTYRANGRVETIDEIVYGTDKRWETR